MKPQDEKTAKQLAVKHVDGGLLSKMFEKRSLEPCCLLNSFSLDGDNWFALESYCTLGAILFPAFSVEL